MGDRDDVDALARNCPTAWFAVLEDAKRRNDFERAAEAVRELRRLGVEVRWKRPRASRRAER